MTSNMPRTIIDTTKRRIRSTHAQLDRNNNMLNDLTTEIADLDTAVEGYTRHVTVTSKLSPSSSDNEEPDEEVIDFLTESNSESEKLTTKPKVKLNQQKTEIKTYEKQHIMTHNTNS